MLEVDLQASNVYILLVSPNMSLPKCDFQGRHLPWAISPGREEHLGASLGRRTSNETSHHLALLYRPCDSALNVSLVEHFVEVKGEERYIK